MERKELLMMMMMLFDVMMSSAGAKMSGECGNNMER